MEGDCDICGLEASLYCKECDSPYCEACSTLTHQHPKRRGHQVVILAEKKEEEKDLPLSQSSILSHQGAVPLYTYSN